MMCVKCGADAGESKFCPECGAPMRLYGLDRETWQESKNIPEEHNKPDRFYIGFSGVILIIMIVILVSVLSAVVWAAMNGW